MESINDVLSWLTDHESAFSALAALVVIFGVVLSPLGAGLRGLLTGRGNSKQNEVSNSEATETKETSTPATQDYLNTPPPLITDKPSIAVLPFVNMSDDKSQEYFADGMTEDIITGLSCDSRLFVIARNSTFAYKGRSPDIRTVGKELGVRYVLEGSIRPINDRLRITVQLIETDTGSHVWADKIDRPIAEIFDIQDDVVDSLVSTLCANLNIAEGKRAARQTPENLKAWQLCTQAEMTWSRQRNAEALKEAQLLSKKATELEPGYALGWAMYAYFSACDIPFLLTDDLESTALKATELSNKAVLLAPDDATALAFAGSAAYLSGKANVAVDYLERGLTLNPNSGLIRAHYAFALICASSQEEAFAQHEIFFRQSPLDPNLGLAYYWRSVAFTTQGNYADAEQSAMLAIKHQAHFPWSYVALALALAGLKQDDDACQAMDQAREIAPHFTLEKITSLWRFLMSNPEDAQRINDLVRKAWMD